MSWTFFTFRGVTQLRISSSDTRPVLSATGECGTTGNNETGLSATGEGGTAADNGAGLIGNTSRRISFKASTSIVLRSASFATKLAADMSSVETSLNRQLSELAFEVTYED